MSALPEAPLDTMPLFIGKRDILTLDVSVVFRDDIFSGDVTAVLVTRQVEDEALVFV